MLLMAAAAPLTVKIDLTFAWCLRPYLAGLTMVALLSGREPDWEKVSAVVDRAVIIRVS